MKKKIREQFQLMKDQHSENVAKTDAEMTEMWEEKRKLRNFEVGLENNNDGKGRDKLILTSPIIKENEV